MALKVNKTIRKFSFGKKDANTILEDPNPKFTPEEVMSFYSGTYPELTNGTVSAPEMKGIEAHYEFKTSLGEKG